MVSLEPYKVLMVMYTYVSNARRSHGTSTAIQHTIEAANAKKVSFC